MKDKLIVTCSCGCSEGFEFNFLDDCIYVSSISSDFYSYQRPFIEKFDKKYKEFYLARNKKINIIKECLVNKEDIENLLIFLKKHLNSLEESKVSDNYAFIYVTKDTFEKIPKFVSYSIEFRSKNKSLKDIFLTKTHRKMELAIQKQEAINLIKLCEKILD